MTHHSIIPVKLTSQHLDGSLMYPGLWYQLWVRPPAMGVSFLVDMQPAPQEAAREKPKAV